MKRILHAFLHPAKWFVALFWIAALVFYFFALRAIVHLSSGKGAIAIYCLLPFVIAYTVYTIIITVPSIGKVLNRFLSRFKLGKRLVTDYGFRSVTFSTISTIINFFYVVYNLVLAVLMWSLWYALSSVLYASLVAMRVVAILSERKQNSRVEFDYHKSYSTYFGIGIAILLYDLVFLGVAYLIVFYDHAHDYDNFMLYIVLGYTIYKITLAVINVFRVMRYSNPVWQAIRNIVFVDALVSVASLQFSLLFAISPGNSYFMIANSVTSVVIFLGIAAIGILMIVTGAKGRKRSKRPGFARAVRLRALTQERKRLAEKELKDQKKDG